jgi:hypothetical protein
MKSSGLQAMITVFGTYPLQSRKRNYKFSSDKLSLTETKLRYPHRRTAIVLSTISSGAYGRDKEMSVNKFMQLWEYGYFVVQELDNVYTKLWDSRGLD